MKTHMLVRLVVMTAIFASVSISNSCSGYFSVMDMDWKTSAEEFRDSLKEFPNSPFQVSTIAESRGLMVCSGNPLDPEEWHFVPAEMPSFGVKFEQSGLYIIKATTFELFKTAYENNKSFEDIEFLWSRFLYRGKKSGDDVIQINTSDWVGGIIQVWFHNPIQKVVEIRDAADANGIITTLQPGESKKIFMNPGEVKYYPRIYSVSYNGNVVDDVIFQDGKSQWLFVPAVVPDEALTVTTEKILVEPTFGDFRIQIWNRDNNGYIVSSSTLLRSLNGTTGINSYSTENFHVEGSKNGMYMTIKLENANGKELVLELNATNGYQYNTVCDGNNFSLISIQAMEIPDEIQALDLIGY